MNDFTSWPASQYAEPISVPDGLRLSQDAKPQLENWWGQRWLEIVKKANIGVRLERGRFYATRGQVCSLALIKGRVEALVQGAHIDPYRVIVAVPAVPVDCWRAVIGEIATESSVAAQLFSRVLPDDFETLCRQAGNFSLFPESGSDFHTKCTCPDWSNPCKHIAAVHFHMAEEFDRDPFLLLRFRGLDREEFVWELETLSRLQADAARVSGGAGPSARESEAPWLDSDIETESDCCPSSGENTGRAGDSGGGQIAGALPGQNCPAPERFWEGLPVSGRVVNDWTQLPGVAALPESLGRFPFWRSRFPFLATIRSAYLTAPTFAREFVTGKQHQTRQEVDDLEAAD
ncbi:MAG TPA: SWIM zinc finger family protein [Candidatus Obscuribacterales bacterium]